MTFADRNSLFLRTALTVLRDADGPLPRRAVMEAVAPLVALTDDDQHVDDQNRQRWQVQLGWRTAEAATVGWMTRHGGWSITEAGVEALDTYPGEELLRELRRRYRARIQPAQTRTYTDPRWALVLDAVSLVGPGSWTSYGDLADLGATSAQAVGGFLAEHRPPNDHRVLTADGTISPGYRWSDPSRSEPPREVLDREGLEFTGRGQASSAQRLTADDFRELLADRFPASTVRRAWLVRGSSVDGRDLVPVWLHKESVSLAAARLRPVSTPIPRDDLKHILDEDYADKSYAARETKFAEFDAFCNRMRVGDYVLTTTQGKAYLGVITSDATFVTSGDSRSNLRRTVEWLNPTGPVPFSRLPQPLPAKLHSQSDVVELTENLAALEELLAGLGIADGTDADAKRRLAFAEITEELAASLLTDRSWLQQQADLLWDHRQLIFYGPPGTGKTYLARALAAHLAEPSAVKLVQFHPSYTYEDFFEGFRPVQRTEGQLAFELRPGPFRQLVEAARQNPADPYILIIDEINRANLAKVFGELYFLLEYRDDAIGLLYSAESDFTLPPNVFLIGTMNTADRSIALVDAAMRRRFAFVELQPDTPPTAGLLDRWLTALKGSEDVEHNLDAPTLLDALNRRIDERDLAIGPSYLMRPQIYRRTDGLARVWETAILPLLAEHHFGAPPEILDRYRLDALRKALPRPTADDETG